MAAAKKKVCKACGYFTEENICPKCGSNAFVDKYKGKVVIFDSENSIVAEKLKIKSNGMYAMKYN